MVVAALISIWLVYVGLHRVTCWVAQLCHTESLSVTGGEPTALLGLHQPPSLSQRHPCSEKAACQSECSGQWGFVMEHCHTEAGWPFLIPHGCLGRVRRLCLVL